MPDYGERGITNNIADTKRGEMTGVYAIVSREEAVQRTYNPEKYLGGLPFPVEFADPLPGVRGATQWT